MDNNQSPDHDLQILNDQVIREAEKCLRQLEDEMASVNHVIQRARRREFKWSEPQNLANQKLNIPGKTDGVYLIYHKDSSVPVYVGIGNMADRVGKFKHGLRNISSTHKAAIKARREDDSADSYTFRYLPVCMPVARLFETRLIHIDYQPKYNDPSMAGK
jgi:hypothetical protein